MFGLFLVVTNKLQLDTQIQFLSENSFLSYIWINAIRLLGSKITDVQ